MLVDYHSPGDSGGPWGKGLPQTASAARIGETIWL